MANSLQLCNRSVADALQSTLCETFFIIFYCLCIFDTICRAKGHPQSQIQIEPCSIDSTCVVRVCVCGRNWMNSRQ